MAGVKRSFAATLDRDETRFGDPSFTTGFPLKQRATEQKDTPVRTSARTPTTTPPVLDNVLARSNTASPLPALSPRPIRPRRMQQDASFVLAGIRGSGKSTLAIMAAAAMKRKVIDLEGSFQRELGMSSTAYRKAHGLERCQEMQAELLRGVLRQNSTGCIIVCSWTEKPVREILRAFCTTHPVIHTLRDSDAIQSHLKIQDEDKARSLLNVSNAMFRACTNFEFFNITQSPLRPSVSSPATQTQAGLHEEVVAPYMTLKQAERHFLKFLSLVYPRGTIPFNESVFPLASVRTEDRQFTYALSIKLSDVLKGRLDVEDHIAGVDAVQLVVDSFGRASAHHSDLSSITEGLGVVRKACVVPIILHIEPPSSYTLESTSSYAFVVQHGLRLSPEMITVDLRLDDHNMSQMLATTAGSRVIGDYHIHTDPPPWNSSIWRNQYHRARRLGCDMARFVRPALSIEDNFAVLQFRSSLCLDGSQSIPIIAYNSGRLGRNSACFNPILTEVGTAQDYEDLPRAKLTSTEATRALYSSFVYDSMKLYVFGFNVDYSMSPAMHNAALEACGIADRYYPYSAESLSGIRHLIEDPCFAGASVGLPFKVEIITLTHSLSRHAQAIGAVNTLIPIRELDENGCVPTGAAFFKQMNRAGPVKALYGDNTDWIGIRDCIHRGLSPANAVRPTTCGVVIGAGGMARAAVYAMLQLGVQNIAIHNRSEENAESMAKHFSQLLSREDSQGLGAGRLTRFHILRSREQPWPPAFSLPTIIISCIPTHSLGHAPAPEFTVPEHWLGSRTGGVIVEYGYKSLDTPLLKQAKSKASEGWVSMDGLDLLPGQGFAQFELFTGRRAPRRIMRRDLLETYASAHVRMNRKDIEPRIRSITEHDI